MARMEEVLDAYNLLYDPAFPVVCFDECCKELHRHLLPPIVDATGTRVDTSYGRNGMAPLHVWIEPHTGRMGAQVTARRTQREFAHAIRDLVAGYPEATRVTIVLDNLNTHRIGAFYQAFPPEEARALRQRVRFVHTPKHGSWLNCAEVAISVLSRAVLKGQRFPTRDDLVVAVRQWVERHNADPHPIDWTFTVDDARARMPRVYPIVPQDK